MCTVWYLVPSPRTPDEVDPSHSSYISPRELSTPPHHFGDVYGYITGQKHCPKRQEGGSIGWDPTVRKYSLSCVTYKIFPVNS